jgi:hypothetical protein
MRKYIKARKHRRRARLVEMLGGCCVRCGTTEALEFDHVDPSTKRFAICSDLSRAWSELLAEVAKCQLLCRPCHVAKGAEDRPDVEHGLYRYEYHKCRCEVCRAANSVASARKRQLQAERQLAESVRKVWEAGNLPTQTPAHGSRGVTRTHNLPVNSRTLCRLSYAGSLAITLAGTAPGTIAARISVAHPGRYPGPGRRGRGAAEGRYSPARNLEYD